MNVEIGQCSIQKLSECIFADDITILAKCKEDMQYNLKILDRELKKHIIIINVKKVVMGIAATDLTTNITLNGETIGQVETCMYLGAALNN